MKKGFGVEVHQTATMAADCFFCVLILLSLFSNALGILDPMDFLALQSIRKGLDDMPGSTFFSTWDFTNDPCVTFSGVLCDTTSEPNKVLALNLGDARAGSPGLTGRLDAAIGKLSALTELTVVPGRVTGQIPDTIAMCNGLQFFGISKNMLWGPIPEGLTGLMKLQTLDLSYNLLTGTVPQGLGSLPALSNVILCHNRLTGTIPTFTSSALIRLDLKRNSLYGSLPPWLPSSLQYLSLSWNKLSGPAETVLARLANLNYLDLSWNEFSGGIPGALFSFPLNSLHLQKNQFTGTVIPLDEVKIPLVDLSHNLFSGHISPLFSAVQVLYLNNNEFTGEVPASFVNGVLASSIQILYLQHNFLTGIQLSPSSSIPLTSSLCISYNCMVPPVDPPCPLRSGVQKTRPTSQCTQLRG